MYDEFKKLIFETPSFGNHSIFRHLKCGVSAVFTGLTPHLIRLNTKAIQKKPVSKFFFGGINGGSGKEDQFPVWKNKVLIFFLPFLKKHI
jgi:hypothetical protein